MDVGIELLNPYLCRAFVDIKKVAISKGIYSERFDKLLMLNKSIHFPFEDPVSCAVNALKPILSQLSSDQKERIDLVITATESGVDLGKSISTYVHKYLDLHRHCRLFEIKQACYGGTAALHMAADHVRASRDGLSMALVVCTDVAQRSPASHSHFEVSQGSGAVAMLVSNSPKVLKIDRNLSGYYSHEVNDTFRPLPGFEMGDPELSLVAYLECLENSFMHYCKRNSEADFQTSFDYLVMHTPFAGMVKGAHRTMMRKLKKNAPAEIEVDFEKRLAPSLAYCREVGNLYSGSAYLALAGLIDHVELGLQDKMLGVFSYGSGCSSEFYSGSVNQSSRQSLSVMNIRQNLSTRSELSVEEYEKVMKLNFEVKLGTENLDLDGKEFSHIYESQFQGKKLLVLKKITGFHREYDWS